MRSTVLKTLIIGTALSLAACGEVVVEDGNGNPDPSLMAISPAQGPLGGGTSATLTGAQFTDAVVVVVGPFVASDIQVSDAGTVSFVTPAGLVSGEPQDVLVFNENGFTTLPAAFTYNPVPSVSAIDPVHGSVSGGTTVTIGGSGFANDNANVSVTIGGVAATNVTVVDDNTITAKTDAAPPAMAFQPQDVVVSSDNGDAIYEQSFFYTRQGLLTANKGRNNLDNRALYFVDPATGDATQFGTNQVPPSRFAMAANGKLYSTGNNAALAGWLIEVDPFSGVGTPIGQIRDTNGNTQRPSSLTAVGSILYSRTRSGYLVSIDPQTAIFTQIGVQDTSYTRASCLAMRDANNAYYIRSFDQTIDTINLSTGAITAGPSLGGMNADERCHGMALFNGSYYELALDRTTGATVLEKVNPANGVRTPLATMPSRVTGLATTPPSW